MHRNLTDKDSWFVLSAYRCGSTVVAELIEYAYLRVGIKLKDLQPVDPPRTEPLSPKEIAHSHNIDELYTINENTNIVVVTRNPVESALSWLIRSQTGIWHHRPKDPGALTAMFFKINGNYEAEDKTVKPFYVDPGLFMLTYEEFFKFYKKLRVALKDKKYTKIDYNEFKNDNAVIFNKLNLEPFKATAKPLPIKTPGSPEQWIENWNEISNIIKNLDTFTI